MHTISSNGDSKWWTQDRIAQLKRRISNPTILTLLNLTAERAGEWVEFKELCQETGRPSAGVKSDLSAFIRLIKREFEDNENAWLPYEIRGNLPTIPTSYRMPAEIARRWIEA